MSLVTDGTKDHLDVRQFFVGAGPARPERPVVVLDQSVLLQLETGHRVLPVDFHRRDEEPCTNLLGLRALAPGNLGGQNVHVALMHAVFGLRQKLRVGLVEFQVRGPHHQVGDLHFGEFPNLRVGERGLGRAAAPQQIDFLDGAFLERFQRVVGDVGRGQFFDRARQDAGDVHRHVAVADDGHALHPAQVVLQVAVVGMPVVPADENGRRIAAGQVFARNTQPAIGFGPGRKQDLVIVAEHLVEEHVLTERDVAEESEARPAGDLLVLADDGLDLLMVGGHAAAHQPIRGRQPVEHIDADGHVFLLE